MLKLNKHIKTIPKPQKNIQLYELLTHVHIVAYNCRTQHSTKQF